MSSPVTGHDEDAVDRRLALRLQQGFLETEGLFRPLALDELADLAAEGRTRLRISASSARAAPP